MGEPCIKLIHCLLLWSGNCHLTSLYPSRIQQVQVYYEGKSRYLGVFKSKLDAAVGYELARECSSSFENNPSEEQAKKNIILMRKAAFTVETGDMEPKPIKNKKQKTT